MEDRERFFDKYDIMMPRFCKPYAEFLKIGSEAVPKDSKSTYDLGIGTGNFSIALRKRIPEIKIYGVDLDEKQIEKAKLKLESAVLYYGDIFARPFPEVDCIISSLATHHFDNYTRRDKLLHIAKSSPLFVNFDMVLFPGYNLQKTIAKVSEFTKTNFLPEQVKEIEKEMAERDNPISLKETAELFKSGGFYFRIIAEKLPYVVYTVSGNKKE